MIKRFEEQRVFFIHKLFWGFYHIPCFWDWEQSSRVPGLISSHHHPMIWRVQSTICPCLQGLHTGLIREAEYYSIEFEETQRKLTRKESPIMMIKESGEHLMLIHRPSFVCTPSPSTWFWYNMVTMFLSVWAFSPSLVSVVWGPLYFMTRRR